MATKMLSYHSATVIRAVSFVATNKLIRHVASGDVSGQCPISALECARVRMCRLPIDQQSTADLLAEYSRFRARIQPIICIAMIVLSGATRCGATYKQECAYGCSDATI